MSYMEIYNNVGYDLLDENPNNRKLDDLPKVKIHKNMEGNIEFSNLRNFQVNNEEEMLNLLFIGDTNRVICQTPLNDVSTRSHCVFMITRKKENSSKILIISGKQRASKQCQDCKQAKLGGFIRIGKSFEDQGRWANIEGGLSY